MEWILDYKSDLYNESKNQSNKQTNMTGVKAQLLQDILKEHFGSVVSQVGWSLAKNGASPLRFIVFKTQLPLSKIKRSLLTLIQHRMVDVKLNSRGLTQYSLIFDQVYQINRYSKFILMARNE